jgi:hypothetical protein
MVHQQHLLNQKKNRTVVNLNPLFYHLVDSQYDQVVFPYQILLFYTNITKNKKQTNIFIANKFLNDDKIQFVKGGMS